MTMTACGYAVDAGEGCRLRVSSRLFRSARARGAALRYARGLGPGLLMALVLAVLAGLALFAAPPALAQPTVNAATVNGDNLILEFSQNLGNGLASAAAFTLTAGDEEIALVYDLNSPITAAYIFEAKLERDVHRGVTVKLSYDPALVVAPAVPLSGTSPGSNVAKFTDRAVSNNTSVHQPLLGSAVVNGTKLTLTYSHELDTGQKPATSAYTVQVGEDARSVTNVRIVPMTKKVELTLASAVTDTDTVKVSYDKPATNPLRGKAASTDAPSFTDYAVTNDTPDTTAPEFSSAAVDGKQLKVTFDETLDTDSAPSGGAFTVKATVGGMTRSITGTGTAEIAAATVTVVLGSAVLSTETVTVEYAKPSSNPLQDAASNEVTDFSGQTADNNSDAPEVSSAAVDGKQLKVTFDEDLDPDSAPSGGAFTVSATVGSVTRTITGTGTAKIDAATVTVVLGSAVLSTETTVTVAYVKPGSNPLQEALGNEVADFSGQTANNNSDAPEVSSAAVDGKQLKVTFDEDLDPDSAPSGGAFTVSATVGSVTRTITGTGTAKIDAATVTVVLGSAVLSTETTVTVAYVKPGSNPLQEALGNEVADFSGQTANNNSDAPEVSSAAVDGKQLKVTFDEDLDPDSAPSGGAFTVSATVDSTTRTITGTGTAEIDAATVTVVLGSAVLSTETTVTVAYVKPGSNPLQEALGNEVADFSGQTANNNSDAPEVSSAAVDGKQLKVTFDEDLDTGSAPSGGAFTVSATVDSTTRTITGTGTAEIDAATVTVVLDSVVLSTETVTVAYAKPGSNPLQDAASNEVATFTGQTADNNSDPPGVSSATVNRRTLTIVFDEELNQSRVGHWDEHLTLTVDDNEWTINAVSTYDSDDHTMEIRIERVRHGQTVKLSYAKPDTDPIRDVAGNEMESFTDKAVTNDTPAVAPEFSSAAVNDATLEVTFDANLDTSAVPATSAFAVTVGTDARNVSSVAISDEVVTLTLASAVTEADNVQVSYTKPTTGNKLRSASNSLEVATFSNQTVTNNTDSTAPTFQSAAVDGTDLKVTFNEELDSTSTPAASAFIVTVGTTARGVNSVGISDEVVTLTLASAVTHTDQVKVRYDKPATGATLRDTASTPNAVVTFGDQAVTNNTGDTIKPVFSSAAVDEAALTITFNENLNSSSTPATGAFTVTVGTSGRGVDSVDILDDVVTLTLASAVIEAETVKVRYTKPATGDTLQDTSANEVDTFSDQTVTNNTEDTDPPLFSSAAVVLTALTVTFDEDLDTGSVPAPGDFRATVNGVRRLVATNGVAVQGAAVILTLASPVTGADLVQISYTQPGNNPLKDPFENKVADFGTFLADNNTPPVFRSASVKRKTLTVTFSEELDSNSVPAPGDFTVTVAGSTRTVASVGVGVNAVEVVLTLTSAVSESEVVRVRYAKPMSNPLRGNRGNTVEVEDFNDQQVTNDTDDTAPVFQSAAVDRDDLTVTFGETLDEDSVPAPGDFIVTVAGSPRAVASDGVEVDGATVILTLTSAVKGGDAVLVRYTQPANGPLQDSEENKVATFNDQTVANGTRPEYTGATVNGDSLTVNFDDALDTGSVPAPGDFTVTVAGNSRDVASGGVAVDATTVTLTLASAVTAIDVVTVQYTPPSSNPLRGINNAGVESFTGLDVTNNTPPAFQSAAVNGAELTITFNEALDTGSVPAPGDFVVTVADPPPGPPRPLRPPRPPRPPRRHPGWGRHRRGGGDPDPVIEGGGRRHSPGQLHQARGQSVARRRRQRGGDLCCRPGRGKLHGRIAAGVPERVGETGQAHRELRRAPGRGLGSAAGRLHRHRGRYPPRRRRRRGRHRPVDGDPDPGIECEVHRPGDGPLHPAR